VEETVAVTPSPWRSLSRCSARTALRLSLILLPSSARTFTRIWSPSFNSSRTVLTRASEISLMWSSPSVPGKIRQKRRNRDTDDLAKIRLADFSHGGDVGNDLECLLGGLAIGGEDVDGAIIVDVNLDAGLLDDAADDLAARPITSRILSVGMMMVSARSEGESSSRELAWPRPSYRAGRYGPCAPDRAPPS